MQIFPQSLLKLQTLTFCILLSLQLKVSSGLVFPKIIGGANAATSITSVDISTVTQRLGAGGASSDTTLVGGLNTPIVIVLDLLSDSYLWSKQLSRTGCTAVSSLTFSPNGDYLIVTFVVSNQANFATLNSVDGSLMLSFFHSSNYLVPCSESMAISNTRQIFGGFGWIQAGVHYWTVISLLPDTLTTSYVKKIANGDVRGLMYVSTSDTVYISGQMAGYLTIASMSSIGTDYFYSSIQSSSTYQAAKMQRSVFGIYSYLTSCCQSTSASSVFGIAQIKVSSAHAVVGSSSQHYFANTVQRCMAVNAVSTSIVYVINKDISNAFKYITKVDQLALTAEMTLIDTFSNMNSFMYDAKFLPSTSLVQTDQTFYYVGYSSKITTNLPTAGSQTAFTQAQAYIINELPSADCVSITFTDDAGVALNGALVFSSYAPALIAEPDMTFVDDTIVTDMLTTTTQGLCFSIAAPTLADVDFDVVTLAQPIAITAFTQTPAVPVQTITYTAVGLPACATFDVATMNILIPVGCSVAVTTSYSISITGTLPCGTSAAAPFTLTLTCTIPVIAPTVIADSSFQIGTAALVVPYTAFSYSNGCGIYTFTYTSMLAGPVALPSFVTFDTVSQSFTVNTANAGDVGVYQIFMMGQLDDPSGTSSTISWTLTILATAVVVIPPTPPSSSSSSSTSYSNQIPYFINDLDDLSVLANQTLEYVLPQTGPSSSEVVIVKFNFTNSSSFATYLNYKLTLKPFQENVGNYELVIKLYYTSTPYFFRVYTLTVTVLSMSSIPIKETTSSSAALYSNISNSTANVTQNMTAASSSSSSSVQIYNPKHEIKPSYQKSITAKIKSISQLGLMKIEFSQDLNVNKTKANRINSTVLDITILSDEEQPKCDLNFTWECTQFAKDSLLIQLTFTYPLNISISPVIFNLLSNLLECQLCGCQILEHFLSAFRDAYWEHVY